MEASEELEETVPEITEEQAEKMEDYKKQFERLFKGLKPYRGKEIKLFQLEGRNEEVRTQLQEIKDILIAGGARATAKDLLQAVVDQALESENDFQFWQGLTERKDMTPGSAVEKFHKFFVKGLENRAGNE